MTEETAEVTARVSAGNRIITVVSFVLALAGLVVVLLRDVFGALGHKVNPLLAAASGIVIAVAAACAAANALADRLPAGWLRRNVRWIAAASTAVVAIVFWVLPAPVERTATKKMTGDTNVAVVDFLMPDAPQGDRAKASAEVAGIVADSLSARAASEHIEVGRYLDQHAPLDDLSGRDGWVTTFTAASNAHIVVGGRMEKVRGVGTRITPIVYMRADAVPDAPELARWLEASKPIITQYDVAGGEYGAAQRDRLAEDLGNVVNDLVLFAQATNDLRAGHPDTAEKDLERLSGGNSGIIPAEELALFQADAALVESQALSGSDRDAALNRAATLLADSTFPRARFALAEVHLQQVAGAGCHSGAVQSDDLAAVATEYERLTGDSLPPLVRLEARLGQLKVEECALRAGLPSAAGAFASSADVRAGAAHLEADAHALSGPEAVAARPLVARALALWPELVLAFPAGQDLAAAASDLGRAIDLERRPERNGTYLLELALLEAQLCHRDQAGAAVRDANDAFSVASAEARMPAVEVVDLTKEVHDGVTQFLSHCAG